MRVSGSALMAAKDAVFQALLLGNSFQRYLLKRWSCWDYLAISDEKPGRAVRDLTAPEVRPVALFHSALGVFEHLLGMSLDGTPWSYSWEKTTGKCGDTRGVFLLSLDKKNYCGSPVGRLEGLRCTSLHILVIKVGNIWGRFFEKFAMNCNHRKLTKVMYSFEYQKSTIDLLRFSPVAWILLILMQLIFAQTYGQGNR